MMLLSVVYFMSVLYSAASTPLEDQHQPKSIENAIIHHMFELIRKLMLMGDSSNGIPVLDPLFINFTDRCFDGVHFNITQDIENGYLTGLSYFELKSFEFNKEDVALNVHLRFPSIEMKAEAYEMSGQLFGVLPLAGKGHIRYRLDDLDFWGKIYLIQSPNGKSILLHRLENAHYNIGSIESATEYDGNIDQILNAMTEDLLTGYLNRFHGYVIATVFTRIVGGLNQYLNHYETWRLIAIIT